MKKIFALGFIGLFLVLSCGKKKEEDAEVGKAFRLSDTMMARCQFYMSKEEDVKNELKLFGKIQADNNKLADVFSLVGGNIIKINVEMLV